MSNPLAYEICVFRNGEWKVDSAYDDREIALFEARRALERPSCMGVRVVEEVFRDETGTYQTQTIFRKTKLDEPNQHSLERQRKSRQEFKAPAKNKAPAQMKAPARNTRRAAVKTQPGFGAIFRILLGAGIVLAGIAVIVYLRSL